MYLFNRPNLWRPRLLNTVTQTRTRRITRSILMRVRVWIGQAARLVADPRRGLR